VVVEGPSDEKDCLSWGAGDGAMAIAALMLRLAAQSLINRCTRDKT